MFEKLGVIGDIHGNALALEAVFRDAERGGVRRFANLGDSLYGPVEPFKNLQDPSKDERDRERHWKPRSADFRSCRR